MDKIKSIKGIIRLFRIFFLQIFFGVFLLSTLIGQKDERFNSNRLKDILPKFPKIQHSFIRTNINNSDSLTLDTTKVEMDGFRVQVFSTRFSNTADSIKTVLGKIVVEKIYITFDAPIYKVRVGNFVSRNNAEKMKHRLVKLGYNSSWIIRSKVFLRKYQLIETKKH